MATHPFAELIDLRVEEQRAGFSELSLAVTKDHLNPHNVVHGAVIYAMADTGMGAALYPTLAAGEICATIEIKISYFKPVVAEDWPLVNGNYAPQRWSTLNQITLANIKGLHPVYMLAVDGVEGGGSRYANASLEGTPLVEDGFMYISNGWGSVYKLDVHSGTRAQINWKMDPQVDKPWGGDVACCGIDNRGVALWKDKVISVTIDGRVIADLQGVGRNRLAVQARRSRPRRDVHGRSAGGEGHRRRRRRRRRIRHPRPSDGLRPQHRQGDLEDLHRRRRGRSERQDLGRQVQPHRWMFPGDGFM